MKGVGTAAAAGGSAAATAGSGWSFRLGMSAKVDELLHSPRGPVSALSGKGALCYHRNGWGQQTRAPLVVSISSSSLPIDQMMYTSRAKPGISALYSVGIPIGIPTTTPRSSLRRPGTLINLPAAPAEPGRHRTAARRCRCSAPPSCPPGRGRAARAAPSSVPVVLRERRRAGWHRGTAGRGGARRRNPAFRRVRDFLSISSPRIEKNWRLSPPSTAASLPSTGR